jgi:hypothetical protein
VKGILIVKTIVVAAALALVLGGCGSGGSSSSSSSPAALTPASSSGDFKMTMSFDPAPPKQGNETILISVKDASGNAVKGALVKARTSMPAMSMLGPALTFQDNGDGTYSAVTNMNYQTKWVLDVKATAGGESGSAEFEQEVK